MAAVCLIYLAVWSRLIESGRSRWLNRPRWRKAIPILVLALLAIWSLVGNSILAASGQYSRRLVDQVVAEVGEPTAGVSCLSCPQQNHARQQVARSSDLSPQFTAC